MAGGLEDWVGFVDGEDGGEDVVTVDLVELRPGGGGGSGRGHSKPVSFT